MIDVKNVTKTFDGFVALNRLSMHVPKGAVYGLVGPNGAGKSTIIRHLTGIYKEDAGDIRIDGQKVYENPKIKARTAYIPDDIYFFPTSTTKDMMNFIRGVYPRFDMDRYNSLRRVFPIDENHQMRRLSKGMQKQAEFWLMLSTRPEILILDEPVDGLDPIMRRQVWSLIISDVAENDTTVLVSSHNLRELEDVCDHVGIMDKGQLLLERSLSELQENITKILIALPDGAVLPQELTILHESNTGKLKTLIVRGQIEEMTDRLSALNPLFMDMVPLSLEEVFIYELGGADNGITDIIL